jgi:hypothetical protein
MYIGMDKANGKDETVYQGKYSVPLALDDGTYKVLHTAYRAGKTVALKNSGITIDHIAKIRDHFEVAYTVRGEAIISQIKNQPKVTCSCGSMSSAEFVMNEIIKEICHENY